MNAIFFYFAGTSGLTVDALAKHDEDHFSKDTDSLQEGFEKLSTSDKLSVGAKTFNTWATNYTECTNVTFNKVHRYWSSNSALHKEVSEIQSVKIFKVIFSLMQILLCGNRKYFGQSICLL